MKLTCERAVLHGGMCDEMIIFVGNGLDEPSSKPEQGCLHFT